MEYTNIQPTTRNYITFQQFNELSDLDKLHYLITQCRKVAQGADDEHQCFLYQEVEFMVLVTFCTKTDELLKIQPLLHCKNTSWSMA
jgi:hypothetical protein